MAAKTAVPTWYAILIIGGAAGDLFRKLDYEFPRAIAKAEAANKTAEVDRLQQEKLEILNNHPGFSRDVLAFNTVTQAWSVAGTIEGETSDPSRGKNRTESFALMVNAVRVFGLHKCSLCRLGMDMSLVL